MHLIVVNRAAAAGSGTGNSNDSRASFSSRMPALMFFRLCVWLFGVFLCLPISLCAETRAMQITQQYLNIPIGREAKMQVFQISVDGKLKREFPAQLAEDSIDYWVFIDVSEFQGHTITLSGSASQLALDRMYQSNEIEGEASLYKEPNRPQFHFTVKRGWSNDVNGPIFYKGQYHLFWQAFPFGVTWDTGFMYWGHAVSKDLVHWRELAPALMVDKLGSPWSGSSLVDRNNDGGWGKDALVLVYTAFDRFSHKQVQCIAYSTDNGVTFTRFAGNPVLDSNSAAGTNDTRDPKVFWYEPTRRWVMVLFEKDGMSFYNSTDLKSWTWQSHLKGLHECPDFFELPVDGDTSHRKWILHGGSSTYFIGSFDGSTFTPETLALRYAEGRNSNGDDILYAAQSFTDMPDGRRVQMAWGRITEQGMAFSQMMLFPTQFRLATTRDGLRMLATPIREIERLHTKQYSWSSLTATDATRRLHLIPPGPLHVKMLVTLEKDDELTIRYQGNPLTTFQFGDFDKGLGSVEILIDKAVAEIFIDGGRRYIVKEIPATTNGRGMELEAGRSGRIVNTLDVYRMSSIWKLGVRDKRSVSALM
jgi:sucrose-6-phosphate hydrolase SacC (GH32 family)